MPFWGDYDRHELSACLPNMPADEFQELCDNIKKNGLMVSIKMSEGKIVDGWHRHLACKHTKTLGVYEECPGDPFEYVMAHNLTRRHLTPAQRAVATAQLVLWKVRGGVSGGEKGASSQEIADMAKVSKRTADAAKKAIRDGYGDQVLDGSRSLYQPKPPITAQNVEAQIQKQKDQQKKLTVEEQLQDRVKKLEEIVVAQEELLTEQAEQIEANKIAVDLSEHEQSKRFKGYMEQERAFKQQISSLKDQVNKWKWKAEHYKTLLDKHGIEVRPQPKASSTGSLPGI